MHRSVMGKLVTAMTMVAAMLVFGTFYGQMLIYEVGQPPPAIQKQDLSRVMSSDDDLDARLKQAEYLWQRSLEDRRFMVEEMGKDRPFPDGYINPYNVWDFARPSFFCPHDLERVGTIGDGGKIVCGMTRYEALSPSPESEMDSQGSKNAVNNNDELIVYSFGVSRDSAFEASLLERTNASIWGYDYSVASWASQIKEEWLPRARFNKLGISGHTDLEARPPMSTIQDLMKANGHTYIDIMKMDIEGAEFDALSSLVDHTKELARKHGQAQQQQAVLPIGQLLLEVHFMKPPRGFSIPSDLTTWLEWWSSLEELGLRAVSNEDNWIGNVRFGKPRFMEYTLINALDKRNKLLFV